MNLQHSEIEDILHHHSLNVDVSGFHGMMSGLICVGFEDSECDDWLPVLVMDRYLSEAEYAPLKLDAVDIFRQVRDELDSQSFEYKILLPSDSHSIECRIQALTSWCKGFLQTFAEYGEIAAADASEDCAEFMEDVLKIASVEVDSEDTVNENEEAIVTLEEHLRVGVQLMYETRNHLDLTEI